MSISAINSNNPFKRSSFRPFTFGKPSDTVGSCNILTEVFEEGESNFPANFAQLVKSTPFKKDTSSKNSASTTMSNQSTWSSLPLPISQFKQEEENSSMISSTRLTQ